MFEYVVRKGGLKESEARWFFQQLIIGVDYLHRMVQPCPSLKCPLTPMSVGAWALLHVCLRHHGRHPYGIRVQRVGLNHDSLRS